MTLVIRAFESHADQNPQLPALRYHEQVISYGELNRRANQVAHYLLANGLQSTEPVCLFFEPHPDYIVALLAIHKAGGIMVPLDPQYPVARLAMVLDDIQPRLLLTHSHLLNRLPENPSLQVCLDKTLFEDQVQNPSVDINPEQTASIFYTSGTTGKPKGVMASQANLTSHIFGAQLAYQVNQQDILPAVARFTFSISLFELLLPLVSGGTLLLLDRDHILNAGKMLETLHSVTFFHIGPSLLKGLLAHIGRQQLPSDYFAQVRHASSGGDMIPPELLTKMRETFTHAEVFVIYGCSEVSCMGCTYPVIEPLPVIKTYVGKAFPHAKLHLLDENHNPVAPGQVGEIAFSGAGVTQGYWKRPELTEEKFIILGDDRVYLTGDIGRLSDDGKLEMLGRRDFQIQLRGMRIELAEIEFSLRRAPGVKDGLVSAHKLPNDEQQLIAYVVFDEGVATNLGGVRDYLQSQLPDYMIPNRYFPLAALPLNHNFKVDRFALPHPDSLILETADDPPVTDTEQALAKLWMELLQQKKINRHDNFFDLGGNSLLGLMAVNAIQETLNYQIDGMDLLRETLALLALMIDKAQGRSTAVASIPNQHFNAQAFYFGPNKSLYAYFQPAREAATNKTRAAVLICPPIGSDWIHTHFIVRKLMYKLASVGIASLRFDFFGTGDSQGEEKDADLNRWRSDLASAWNELGTQVPDTPLLLLGIGLGGGLALEFAQQQSISQPKVWASIVDGAEHLSQLRKAQKLLHLRYRPILPWLKSIRPASGEELLGFHYGSKLIADLETFTVSSQLSDPPLNLASPDWYRHQGREQLLADTGLSDTLLKAITEELPHGH